MQQVTSTTARPAISITAARLSAVAALTAGVLLLALHLLSPEFDPTWRMVSEYALGRFNWVLSLLFLFWAASGIALFFAVRPQVSGVGGKIGLGLLFISSLGMSLAAYFDFRSSLHGLATLLGVPTFPAAATLLSLNLSRSQAWSAARRAMAWAAALTWGSLVVMIAAVFIGLSQSGGEFGPGVLVGLPNRLLVLAYCAWNIVVARQAIQLDRD